MSVADVTVIIPTIGRPHLLANTLSSLASCQPRPAEVLVVDQSPDRATADVVDRSGLPGARRVGHAARGRGAALNEGLRLATHDLILITDDDCVVRQDWVCVAVAAMADQPQGIVTGQVLPGNGDIASIPSCLVLDEPRDYTGQLLCGVLYGGNMACSRAALLSIGAFDERVVPSAEDCDLCYRWLRAGRVLRHVPELVIWHCDWRSPDQLSRLYVTYWRGSGVFYAKHLRAGDRQVSRFIAHDLYSWLRCLPSALRGVPRARDARRGIPRGLPAGLWAGWRRFGPRGEGAIANRPSDSSGTAADPSRRPRA